MAAQLKNVFLAVFCVATVIHLYFCFRDIRKGRVTTKPFLIISLLAFYLCASPEPKRILVMALIFSWIGDILLIGRGDLWLLGGGASFIAAHICLMFYFCRLPYPEGWSFGAVIVEEMILLCIGSWTINRIGSKPGGLIRSLLRMYLMINAAMNLFALMDFMVRPDLGSGLAVIGALMFFLSDCALFLLMYCEDPPFIYKRNFTIMVTYLLAETLIAVGDLIG